MTNIDQIIEQNLKNVFLEILTAADGGEWGRADAKLVAVTKYAKTDWIRSLHKQYQVFGENRPQQLQQRSLLFPDAEWHLIGQLQKNKIRMAVTHSTMIHSIDSLSLLFRILNICHELEKFPQLLLQVNVSGENSKSGFSIDEIRESWPQVLSHPLNSQIVGLMTMAPESEDAEEARPHFQRLRELRNELQDGSTGLKLALPQLSMGMSGDFRVAVQEGATLVRIGSRLFSGLDP